MHTKRHGLFRRFHSTSFAPGASRALAVGTVLASGVATGTFAPPVHASAPAVVADAQPASAQTFRFAIPGGPVTNVLDEFVKVTGVTVAAAADLVRGLTSAGVTGTYSAEEGLRRLLEGTALSFRFTSATAAVVELRTASEAVEVTGRLPRVDSPRYATPLSATPQTIQVIPQAVMAEQGTFTLSDALRNVPGITLQAGEGGGASSTAGDMFNMRGFSAANSLFVDNVRDDGLLSRDVYNLEQVEVYLGPTGTDVGRGNAAGYINMASKTPRLGAAYSGTVSLGSASQQRVTADLNQPIPLGESGSWLSGTSLRLNALWQDFGVPGRDLVEQDRRSIAPSLAMGLGTPTRVILAGQFTRQDNLPDYGIPAAAWKQPLTATAVLATSPVDQATYYGSPGYDYDKADQDNVTARVEHDFANGWTVRNQTRYNQTSRDAVITSIASAASFVPATQTVTFSRQANRRDNEILSNQTTVTGRAVTGGITHALSLGLEFADEDYSAPGMGGAGTREAASIYSPNPFATVSDFAPAPTGATTDGTTATRALSVFDVVNIGPRVQVNGGMRWENYDTDYRTVSTAGVVSEISASDNLFSGKLGFLYQLSPSGNLYVAYGTTVTPPGSGNFALSTQANNANNPNVDPQISRNIEVGTKWDVLNRRLSLTAAVFDTRNTNVIYTIDATAVPPLFNQDDGQIVQGVTLGLTGSVERWNIFANIAYMDGKQDSQNPATDGRQLTLMPNWSGSLWTTYTLPRGFSVGGGIRFTEKAFVNTANTLIVPSYKIVDAVASYAVNSHLTLRANIYNLTDEVYIRSISNNGGRYAPGLARAILVSTQIGF